LLEVIPVDWRKMSKFRKSFVASDKKSVIYRRSDEIEVVLKLTETTGLLVGIWNIDTDKVQVSVLKTSNGCPGCGKADFQKFYRNAPA
jgi:hypothetical protein